MVRVTKVVIKDDFTGEEIQGDARTVNLTLDGMTYELDLSDASYQELLTRLEPFIRNVAPVQAKVTRQRRVTTATAASPTTIDREQGRAMRRWWRAAYDAGMTLPNGGHIPTPSDRGRIPVSVVNLYHSSGGKVPNHTTNSDGQDSPAEAGVKAVKFSSAETD